METKLGNYVRRNLCSEKLCSEALSVALSEVLRTQHSKDIGRIAEFTPTSYSCFSRFGIGLLFSNIISGSGSGPPPEFYRFNFRRRNKMPRRRRDGKSTIFALPMFGGLPPNGYDNLLKIRR